MALEDFTTYTEEDSDGRLTVTTNTIDVDGLDISEGSKVWKDFTAGHFGDFEFLVSGKQISYTGASTGPSVCHLDNENVDYGNITGDAVILRWYYSSSGGPYYYLQNVDGGSATNDRVTGTAGTTYYFTFKRSGTSGTLKMYTDSDRTNLRDTAILTVVNTTLRYLQVVAGRDHPTVSGRTVTLDIYDLDLQEGVTYSSSGLKIWNGNEYIDIATSDDTTATDKLMLWDGSQYVRISLLNPDNTNASNIYVWDGSSYKCLAKV